MNYFKTKKMKLIIILISLLVLFNFSKFIKSHITNLDLPKGKIVFSSDVDGDDEIYTMNINGTDLKQLTYNSATKTSIATDSEASFSLDGKRIVFKSSRTEKINYRVIADNRGRSIGEEFSGGSTDIYIMDSDGKNQIPLTHNTLSSDPFFSSDAKKIIFRALLKDGYTLIKLMNTDGSGERILSVGGQAKFSSDGKKLFDNFESDVSVEDIDGNNKVKLTHFSDSKERQGNRESQLGIDFDLSSDGKKIALVTMEGKNNHINRLFKFYTMNIDGSDLEEIYKLEAIEAPGFIFTFSCSRDGKYIVFNADLDKSGIYLLNPENNNLINLTEGKENWSRILDFTFTPDGKRIVFVAGIYPKNYYMHAVILRNIKAYINYFIFRKQTPYYDNKYICIMDMDGKNYRRIAKLPVGSELGRDFIHWED